MNTVPDFRNQNSTISTECIEYYKMIQQYAKHYGLKNTLIALSLACKLHDGVYRDGGKPYIIHPLEITQYLILLNVRNGIFDMHITNLYDENLANQQTNHDLDILFATALLHDVIEDCKPKLPNQDPNDLITVFNLDPEVLFFVNILTKDKTQPGFTINGYYENISKYWQTILIKVADRTNNCSTIDAFDVNRMKKYVIETRTYFYEICSIGKDDYPNFSRILTIMKYLIVSICETVAAALNLKDITVFELSDKTYYFLKGFSINGKMQNTLKALPLAKKYYNGYFRKNGDAFIIHPLRVASYLISLKVDDDIICSTALLHEIINKCNLEYNGIEIVTKHHIDPTVLDYIKLLSNVENYPMQTYYEVLMQRPEVLILKLSNRANTCTKLIDFSDEEIKAYVEECETYIYPACNYGIKHYTQYADCIKIMQYHITSLCNIVKTLRLS